MPESCRETQLHLLSGLRWSLPSGWGVPPVKGMLLRWLRDTAAA